MTILEVARQFTGRRITVVGDVMLDHFVVGQVDRISPEAPVPVVRFARDEFRLGGAANVAHNVAALGGVARVIGVVGDDSFAEQLRAEGRTAGLDVSGLVTDSSRPTTRKMRIVTLRNQQVARIDYETDRDASATVAQSLAAKIHEAAPRVRRHRAVRLSEGRRHARGD